MPFLDFAIENLPALLEGAAITLQMVAISIVAGFLLGGLIAFARVFGGRPVQLLATGYIEIFRGTPLLVQLFILYFGLPNVGIYMSAFTAACVGMSLNSAAYQAEYFRSALQSIRSGQMLAARAVGMTQTQGFFTILVPQAVRRALPAWSNELMYMIKYSSVAYMIQAPELMAAGKEISSETFRTFETYVLIAIIYLVMVMVVGAVLKFAEARLRIPGV